MRAVNLIPAEQRERSGGLATRSEGVAHIVLGMLGCIALLALLYGIASHEVKSKESEATSLEARAQTTQQQASGLAEYKSFVSLRESREQAIVGLINSRFDWAHALSELGRVLPPGSTVTTITGGVGTTGAAGAKPATSSSSSAAVTSATPAGSVPSIAITGCAASQSTVSQLLTRLKLMDGVNNVELHSSEKAASASGGTGSCPAGAPDYTATISFEALPSGPTTAPSKPSTPASSAGGQGASATDASAKGNG